jgi:5-(carboxyamino)imidazole ribonucleotide mutase
MKSTPGAKTSAKTTLNLPKVAIIMGSDSDLPVMSAAKAALDEFALSYEIRIVSAHRTPEEMVDFAKSADENGFGVIIAGAGGAAHLPGMVASLTVLPVIGVPVQIGNMQGLDALLSIVQMPKGVPVATVAVDNAYNAGLLAVRILSVAHEKLRKEMTKFQDRQRRKVSQMNTALRANLKNKR